MENVKTIIATVWMCARQSPKLALSLTLVGFLGFVIYVALAIANDGSLVFAMYVLLVIAAFVVLVFMMLLDNVDDDK